MQYHVILFVIAVFYKRIESRVNEASKNTRIAAAKTSICKLTDLCVKFDKWLSMNHYVKMNPYAQVNQSAREIVNKIFLCL